VRGSTIVAGYRIARDRRSPSLAQSPFSSHSVLAQSRGNRMLASARETALLACVVRRLNGYATDDVSA
jgi:hypothetical protein